MAATSEDILWCRLGIVHWHHKQRLWCCCMAQHFQRGVQQKLKPYVTAQHITLAQQRGAALVCFCAWQFGRGPHEPHDHGTNSSSVSAKRGGHVTGNASVITFRLSVSRPDKPDAVERDVLVNRH